MKVIYLWILFILILSFPLGLGEKATAYRGLASSWTVVPSRSLAGLHYIFKGFDLNEEQGIVKVKGPVVEIINGDDFGAKVHREGYFSEMDLEDFEEEQKLAEAVFEATTRNASSVGTAFLVGNDLVLTNRHVMNYLPNAKKWQCGKFSIKLNHKKETVNCQKVRYCSSRFDYCVVEMKKMINGLSLGSELKPLRLTRKVRSHQDAHLLHIGNAGGMGIQASRGKGLKIRGGEFYHYIPTLGGSSGAPIFNERGEVIGLNWGLTGDHYASENSYNRGVLIETVFNELHKTHVTTLKDIRSFRYWYRSKQAHRQVRIEH